MSLRARVDASNADQAKYTGIVKARKEAKSAAGSSDNARSLANFPFECVRPRDRPADGHRYFSRRVDAMAEQLAFYRAAAEVRSSIAAISLTRQQIRSQLAHHDPDQVKAILPTLRHQNQLTVALASKIASLHAHMAELEAAYLVAYRERTHSVRNPFEERRAEARGASADAMNV